MSVRPWIRFARPFTLLPPLLGILAGSACAFGSAHNLHPGFTASLFWTLAAGSVCASLMNAASNMINQVFDLAIDRVNKPGRPLCTGEIGVPAALRASVVLYAAALVPTWWIVPPPYDAGFLARFYAPPGAHACFWLFLGGLVCTFVYSAPFLGRTKRYGIWANVTVATARGELLKVAGWSMVASTAMTEPWYLGGAFFLFLLGATSTKDFSDVEGDALDGCRTLPVVYGPRKAAWMIAPFFVLPWLMLPLGTLVRLPSGERLLTGNPVLLDALGAALVVWGAWTVYLLLRSPEDLAANRNHPAWTHMYAMMMAAQVGLAVAYLV